MKQNQLSSLLGIIIAAAFASPVRAAEPPVIRLGWSVPAQTQHYVMMKKPDLLKGTSNNYAAVWPTNCKSDSRNAQGLRAGAVYGAIRVLRY